MVNKLHIYVLKNKQNYIMKDRVQILINFADGFVNKMPIVANFKVFTVPTDTNWVNVMDEVNDWLAANPNFTVVNMNTEKYDEIWKLDKETGEIHHSFEEQFVIFYTKIV